jgi:hypothetical protein
MPHGTVRTASARISAAPIGNDHSGLPDHYVDLVGELRPVSRINRRQAGARRVEELAGLAPTRRHVRGEIPSAPEEQVLPPASASRGRADLTTGTAASTASGPRGSAPEGSRGFPR